MKAIFPNFMSIVLLLLLLASCGLRFDQKPIRVPPHITVSGTQWGKSSCYIGAVEGSSTFNISDLQDLGINTYRIYGGMSRWDPLDQHGIYGLPSIDQIKANPDSINWSRWDDVMTNPPGGSDYWWIPSSPRWQGNARTLFSNLKSANIRPILVLRNRDDNGNPSWAPNPPRTNMDWNVWWGYVFATVYWLNVRNSYNVNDFEVHNEPDQSDQGWKGTQFEYFAFAWYTANAIDYVYKTYLPGRTYHIYGPVTSVGSSWPNSMLKTFPNSFDSMDIHDYDPDISVYVRKVHQWMNQDGHSNYPLWITEWGSYSMQNPYNSIPFGITLLNNLIRASQPGDDYVYGSHFFSLYDFSTKPLGLIDYNGKRRADYYAMRMGIRALQGCRPTYQSLTNNSHLLAITTKDAKGNIYLLITNQDNNNAYTVNADLSRLLTSGHGTIWQFDAAIWDAIAGHSVLENGKVQLKVPASGALLVKFVP